MPYTIAERKLSVFLSPKGAGTTIRAALFRAENGFAFRPYTVQGKKFDENSICRNNGFDDVDHAALAGYERVAILRDPVRRFLSAYSNRVLQFRELSEAALGDKLRKRGLRVNPDLGTFVDRLDEYRRVQRRIGHHTCPQQQYLGEDPAYFTHIFRIEDMGAFSHFLVKRFGPQPALPRLQTGGPKISVKDVLPMTLRRIEAFVANDIAYQMYSGYGASNTMWLAA